MYVLGGLSEPTQTAETAALPVKSDRPLNHTSASQKRWLRNIQDNMFSQKLQWTTLFGTQRLT